jgi:transposase
MSYPHPPSAPPPGESDGTSEEPTTPRCPPPGEPLGYDAAVALLDPVPGIGVRAAEAVLAEIGTDMERFPTEGQITAWAGVAPGNRESAGKSYSGKTTPGNPALRQTLIQAAHAAMRVKDSYFAALYRRLAGRRGKKRALVAVARALLVAIYHILKTRKPYHELGADYYDRIDRQALTNRLLSRLEQLGYQVHLEPKPALTA